MTTLKQDEIAVENEAKRLLAPLAAKLSSGFTHLSGQAIAWLVLETHHVTSAEAGIVTSATLAFTAALTRVKKWLAAA